MSLVVTMVDTGKRRTSSGSAEETDKANSGNTITFYGVEMTVEESSILNTKPVPGLLSGGSGTAKFASGEVDHLGVSKPKWTLRGVLRDNNNTDLAMIKVLRDLNRTKGYKTLYGTIPDWVDGAANSSGVNVRVQSVTMNTTSNAHKIDYTIVMFETS